MDKLSDAEIIKAFEVCESEGLGCEDGCLYNGKTRGRDACFQILRKDVLDLINGYKAEIERYKGVIKILESDVAKTKVETTKEFAKYLIDNDEDGGIKTIDLPELVCDFLHPVEKVEHDSLCETETYKGVMEECH